MKKPTAPGLGSGQFASSTGLAWVVMDAAGSADDGHTQDDEATATGLGADDGHTQDEEANCNLARLGAVREREY